MNYRKLSKILMVSGCVLAVAGCASIHSEDPAMRQKALAALATDTELLECFTSAQYDDMRYGALQRMSGDDALTQVLYAPDTPENYRLTALERINESGILMAAVYSDRLSERVRQQALMQLKPNTRALVELLSVPALNVDTKKQIVRILHTKSYDMYAIIGNLILPTEVRLLALRGAGDPLLFSKVVKDVRQDGRIREEALASVHDQAALEECFFSLGDDVRLQELAFERITDEPSLKRIVLAETSTVPTFLRERAMEKIDDQIFISRILGNESVPLSVQEIALKRLSDATVAADILRRNPQPPEWIGLAAVNLLSETDTLSEVAQNPFAVLSVRKAAAGRIGDNSALEKLLQQSQMKEIRVVLADLLLERNAKLSEATLRLFLQDMSDLRYAAVGFDRLDLSKLPETAETQKLLARILAHADTDERRKKAADVLFFPAALETLVMEAHGENEALALWAIDRDPGNRVLLNAILKSPRESIQSRSILRLTGDRYLKQAALSSPNQSVRLSAVSRLSAAERKTLRALAQSEDPLMRMAALRRLHRIGDSMVPSLVALDRDLRDRDREEAERLIRQKAKQQTERRQKLDDDILRERGNADASVYFVWLNGSSGKFSLENYEFYFTGRVTGYWRNSNEDPGRVQMEVYAGDRMLTVTAQLSTLPPKSIRAGDYLWVDGRLESGDGSNVFLNQARCEPMKY